MIKWVDGATEVEVEGRSGRDCSFFFLFCYLTCCYVLMCVCECVFLRKGGGSGRMKNED